MRARTEASRYNICCLSVVGPDTGMLLSIECRGLAVSVLRIAFVHEHDAVEDEVLLWTSLLT